MSDVAVPDRSGPDRSGPDRSNRRPSNRRALILSAAIDLFHERGYHATGVDDIGKAVHVSGPAIYRHFDSKEEILLEAIRLAADQVHTANEEARAGSADPRELLERFVRNYVVVAIEQAALIAVWTSEARHLTAARRTPMTRRLGSWHREWVEQLRVVRPDVSAARAALLVTGAIGVITTSARTDSFHAAPTEDDLTAMAMAVLDTDFH